MKVIKTWTLTLLCLSAGVYLPADASQIIYQWKDAQGERHFSDQPQQGAKKRELQDAQSYKATTLSINPPPLSTDNVKEGYSLAEITSPRDTSTIRNTTGTLFVTLTLKPKLELGDNVQFLLDNKPMGTPQKELTFEFTRVFRGEHTISAIIIDANDKKIISTKAITIFMHPPLNKSIQINNNLKVLNKVALYPVTQTVKL